MLKVLVFRYVQTQKQQSLQTQGMHRNTMLHTCFCDMLTQFTLTVAISIFSVLSAVIHNCKKTFFVISDNTAHTTLIVFMKSHVFDAFLCFIDPLFIVFKWYSLHFDVFPYHNTFLLNILTKVTNNHRSVYDNDPVHLLLFAPLTTLLILVKFK